MNALLGAINALILLAVVLAIVWVTGRDPGQLSLTWQGTEYITTAAFAAIAGFIGLTLAFYLGQFISWLSRLPATIRGWFRPAPPKPELARLVEVLSLAMSDDLKQASKLLDKVNPKPEEEVLEAFARLQLGLTDPAELERWVANPHLGPYASLTKAQLAATQANWELAKVATQQALESFGKLPAHSILHLKALLNLGETAKAQAFLGTVRPYVSQAQYALLDMAIQGPTSTTAAKLDDPWFAAFQQWLKTASVTVPDVPPAKRRG